MIPGLGCQMNWLQVRFLILDRAIGTHRYCSKNTQGSLQRDSNRKGGLESGSLRCSC